MFINPKNYKIMKQIMLSMCVMIACVVCVSCSGGKSIEKMIPASKVEITGNGAEFISITDDVKIYTVPDSDNNKYWSIRATVPIENRAIIDGNPDISANLDLLDGNHSQIDDDYGMGIQDDELFASLLKSDIGTQKMIAFIPIWENISYHKYKTIADFMERAENITITLKITTEQQDNQTIVHNNSSKKAPANNWDSVLNEYDKFVNQYISLYKKAMTGDMNALTEYASYLEKIDALSDKLDAAEGSMTTAQMNRYLKITERMTDAILEE